MGGSSPQAYCGLGLLLCDQAASGLMVVCILPGCCAQKHVLEAAIEMNLQIRAWEIC